MNSSVKARLNIRMNRSKESMHLSVAHSYVGMECGIWIRKGKLARTWPALRGERS